MARKRSRNRSRRIPKKKSTRRHPLQIQVSAPHFPWKQFFVRLIDSGQGEGGCLEIEYANDPADQLGLSPPQITLFRMLMRKLIEANERHRAASLISTQAFVDELSERHEDPRGERVWDPAAVHDLIYDIRQKLRASNAARWAVKEVGEEFDFGEFLLGYENAYRKYGLALPADRIEIVSIAEKN